jgi:hypothetical protein
MYGCIGKSRDNNTAGNPAVIVQQVPPQIQVNVAAPPGLPEWVKILITAGAGALVGIGSRIIARSREPAFGTFESEYHFFSRPIM